ncbi:hypothetical protein B0H19DRAFT_1269984 [Mycena capillaripes]|nr:hypothetical protein B0H19DRAFT_1269984 [Mycena capillaripes]
MTKGATETTVYLPEDEVHYDDFSHHVYRGAANGKDITVKAELHQVPVFLRELGLLSLQKCIFTRDRHVCRCARRSPPQGHRPRRSSPLMKLDPFTLRVTSKAGSPHGDLYLDDGISYSHAKGQFV